MDLLECLEKKAIDAVSKKRMENRIRSGLVSTDLLTAERPQMCLLCLSPLTGIDAAAYSGLTLLVFVTK